MTQKSYDRQDGETVRSYAAFCIYRNMGAARSLEKTAQEFYDPDSTQKRPRNKSQISAWSSKWSWCERVRDFDLDEETIVKMFCPYLPPKHLINHDKTPFTHIIEIAPTSEGEG